ncbi:6805_t:CDS:10, partial [Dentiscutata erythropus]
IFERKSIVSFDPDSNSQSDTQHVASICPRRCSSPGPSHIPQKRYYRAKEADLESTLWSTPGTIEKLSLFANNSQKIAYHLNDVALISITKIHAKLDTTFPIQSQIQILNLPGPATISESASVRVNSYEEAIYSCIHYSVAPYYNAYVANNVHNEENKKFDNNHIGVPMTKKKINELELSFLHLQKNVNVEIPLIFLNIHPVVQKAVEKGKQEGRQATIDFIDPELLSDTAFLNKLQSDLNSWIKEIQKITNLTYDLSSGTAIHEINFWLNMETALERVDKQLKSNQIVLTFEILRHAKRFHATVSFMADTGLKDAKEKAQKYNQLMRDFPLDELLYAPDVVKIKEAINVIFNHFIKKMRLNPYPIKRALYLVEAISRDLNDVLLKVLGSRRLMYMEYNDFEKIMEGAKYVFGSWDGDIKEFTNVARDVMRKRSDKFIPIIINPTHDKLQERITSIWNFRKQHAELYQTIVNTMSQPKNTKKIGIERDNQQESININKIDFMEEIKVAYESVNDIDVLDTSVEGTEIWIQAENSYNERVSRVEDKLIVDLRDRFGKCKNTNEMFRVFSKYNALFVRPKVHGAIKEYQNELIDRIKKDISKLYDRFNQQYYKSEANHMAQIRDLPTVSGAMIWARQIEKQLYTYKKRIEDVLGKDWELYAEGQKLKVEINNFKMKLDASPIFEAWMSEIFNRKVNMTGRLFEITRNRSQGNILQLGISFDPQIITLFKEVRNLLWLDYQVPYNITQSAKVAKKIYPFAVSLMETVKTYAQTVQKIQKQPDIVMLVASYRNNVQAVITKGINFEWKYLVDDYSHTFFDIFEASYSHKKQHDAFIREFANIVSEFQYKVDSLITNYEDILRLIEDLKRCAYQAKKFNSNLEKIQKLINRLNAESYSNLDAWVAQLDKRIDAVLIQRLQHAISAWITEFIASDDDSTNDIEPNFVNKIIKNARRRTDKIDFINDEGPIMAKTEKPVLVHTVHEVRVHNRVIYLDPPIEEARIKWYNQLHEWLSVVCNLPRIQGSRNIVQQVKKSSVSRETTYSNLLAKIFDGSLEKAYEVIETKLKEVSEYVNKWIQFQSLWYLEPNNIYNQLGDDLNKWKQILSAIKKSRITFDNSDIERSFGFIVVDYEQVQSKINAKYDQWQLDVLNKFAIKLGNSMREFYSKISNSRNELENKSMENNNTNEVTALIILIQDIKHKMSKWNLDAEIFREGHKILERQRYQFPSDWVHIEQLEGEWSAFNEILDKKDNQIQEQIDGLILKIKNFVSDWNKNKPIGREIKPNIALYSLSIFENRVTCLKDEYDIIYRVKEALDMNLTIENRLDSILEEIRDLKAVWSSLSKIWQSINLLKETPWSLAVPQEIQQQLKNILNSIKELPRRIHSYSAFGFLEDTVKTYIKPNPILYKLKSEALKEHHWRKLFKVIKLENCHNLSEMTVGHVLDFDQIIKNIVIQFSDEENENDQIINNALHNTIQASDEVALEKHKNEQTLKDVVAQSFGEMTLKELFIYLLSDNNMTSFQKVSPFRPLVIEGFFKQKFISLLDPQHKRLC